MESYFRYWGKAQPINELNALYHPLVYHSLDVAAVGRELVYHYRPCIKLAKTLSMPMEVFADISTFFLSLHDIGKFAASFQSLVSGLSVDLVPADISKPYEVRHDTLGYLLWKEQLQEHSFSQLGWEISDQDKNCLKKTCDQWMQIVTGHHGTPPYESEIKRRGIIRYFNEADIIAAKEFLTEITKLPFFPRKLPIQFFDKSYQKIFALASWNLNGIAILADWLGSDQNVFHYCSQQMSLGEYWNQAIAKAALAVKHANLNYQIQPKPVLNTREIFTDIEKLTPLQQYCNDVKLYDHPQLFILEDVTGAGKTEAALILAQRIMALGLADGFYIGLPTMATANAMYERMAKIYQKLFTDESLPSLILSHSKNRLSERFNQALQPADRAYQSDEETASAWCNRWFADNRKKSLLADIGVGTLDQALLSVLPIRHQTLRQLGLANKILIADEIHAYDHYTGTLLSSLLEAHARQGGSAILLSATIPQTLRQTLVQSFQKGLDSPKTELSSDHFPLATQVSKEPTQEVKLATRISCQRQVRIEMITDETAVHQKIQQALVAGQCVCWIRNTVKDAVKTYKIMFEQMEHNPDKIRLFHSRFALIDRLRIEKEVIDHFGRNSNAEIRFGQVLIATQVVEQSLDLDFDLIISDIAPIDLLIQRMGRLHRHTRDSSGNFLTVAQAQHTRNAPIFYIYGPQPTSTPQTDWLKAILPDTQRIYQDVGKLWLTQQLLIEQGTVTMPDQARTLIESVYGHLKKDIPSTLEKLSNEAEGKQYCDRSQANFNRISPCEGYCWESSNHGGWSEEINTPTRLGDDMTEIILVVSEQDQLRPYAVEAQQFQWDMSTLAIHTINLDKLNKFPPEILAKLETLKKQVPQLKNYSVLVPMIHDKVKDEYLIYQYDHLIAHYSLKFGLEFE